MVKTAYGRLAEYRGRARSSSIMNKLTGVFGDSKLKVPKAKLPSRNYKSTSNRFQFGNLSKGLPDNKMSISKVSHMNDFQQLIYDQAIIDELEKISSVGEEAAGTGIALGAGYGVHGLIKKHKAAKIAKAAKKAKWIKRAVKGVALAGGVVAARKGGAKAINAGKAALGTKFNKAIMESTTSAGKSVGEGGANFAKQTTKSFFKHIRPKIFKRKK